MALSKVITKKSVTLTQPKLYSIVFNLTLSDGGVEVLNQDFSVEYHTGDNVASKTAKVIEDMQGAVDKYKAEQVILNAAAMDTAVTTISNGVQL